MPIAEEFPSCNYWPFSHDEKIRIWNVRGELQMRDGFQIQVVFCYVWQSAVWAEWRERLHVAVCVPFPTCSSESTSLLPLCCSWFPELGFEGRAGEEPFPQGQTCQALLTPTTVQCMEVCCVCITSSVFLFLPEVWFWLLQLPDGPMAQSFDFKQPIPVPSHALVHCVFADLYVCCYLKGGEGASQIIMRMTLVMNEAVLVLRNSGEWVAQQYVCFLRLFSAALV